MKKPEVPNLPPQPPPPQVVPMEIVLHSANFLLGDPGDGSGDKILILISPIGIQISVRIPDAVAKQLGAMLSETKIAVPSAGAALSLAKRGG